MTELEINPENPKESWDKLLDSNSLHKLLYSLKIVKKLKEEKEWIKKFIERGGITHIYDTIQKYDMAKLNSSLSLKAMSLLIVILEEFINSDESILKDLLNQDKELFVEQLIKLMHANIKQTLLQE